MGRFLLRTIFTLTLISSTLYAEEINNSTTAASSSTLNPNAEKSTDLEKGNKFINAVENYLSEATNAKQSEPQNQLQGYMAPPMYPVYPAYNAGGYFYPGVNPNAVVQANNEVQTTNYLSAVFPAAQAALQAGLKLFAKVGLLVMGGAGLLVIGGIFTTLVCYITPFCTITFNGYDFQKTLNKETMRSLMTPEKIASAAALVQDAIGKYQRLQRAVGQQ